MTEQDEKQTRTTTPPARPRDRGDRWAVAGEWFVSIVTGLGIVAVVAVVANGVIFGTIDGAATIAGMTPVQALALALGVACVLLPAILLGIHRWVRPILRDRQPDDVDAVAVAVADSPQGRGFRVMCFCDECADLAAMTVCDRAAALEQQQRGARR